MKYGSYTFRTYDLDEVGRLVNGYLSPGEKVVSLIMTDSNYDDRKMRYDFLMLYEQAPEED